MRESVGYTRMIVQLIAADTEVPALLSPQREYAVIGIEADSFRIVNDDGEPCLYDHTLFAILDDSEPAFWISSRI